MRKGLLLALSFVLLVLMVGCQTTGEAIRVSGRNVYTTEEVDARMRALNNSITRNIGDITQNVDDVT